MQLVVMCPLRAALRSVSHPSRVLPLSVDAALFWLFSPPTTQRQLRECTRIMGETGVGPLPTREKEVVGRFPGVRQSIQPLWKALASKPALPSPPHKGRRLPRVRCLDAFPRVRFAKLPCVRVCKLARSFQRGVCLFSKRSCESLF